MLISISAKAIYIIYIYIYIIYNYFLWTKCGLKSLFFTEVFKCKLLSKIYTLKITEINAIRSNGIHLKHN